MKKEWLFVTGTLLLLATSAHAGTFVAFHYGATGPGTAFDIVSLTNPRQYQLTVFTLGSQEAANLPPARGGKIVILDITDRTWQQMQEFQRWSENYPGRRFRVMVGRMPRLMRQEIYYRGFLTTKWDEISKYIWDKDMRRRLAGTQWKSVGSPILLDSDNCHDNCDFEACLELGDPWIDLSDSCDCEVYEGRTFCHPKNRYTYSEEYDH